MVVDDTAESNDRSIRTVFFKGTTKDFTMWYERFLSGAHLKGPNNKKVLLGLLTVPKESENLEAGTPDITKVKRTNRKANNQAYNMLLMAVDDETSFGAVSGSKTTDLPNGDAEKAMKAMIRIWKPKKSTKKYSLEDEFNNSKLVDVSQAPDKWFQSLDGIVMRLEQDFQVKYDEEKVMGHILHNLKPKEYENTVDSIKRDITRGNATSLDSVKDDIREKYADIAKREGFNDEYQEDTETALTTTGGFKKNAYKGDCRVCGKKGHKGNDCWENSANKDKRPSFYKSPSQRNNGGGNNTGNNTGIVCGYCNKKGHKEDVCYKKTRDKGGSNSGSNSESAEIMLITSDFVKNNSTGATTNNDDKLEDDFFDYIPGTEQVLLNKEDMQVTKTLGTDKLTSNTFIADSAATSHMKFSLDRMIDLVPWKIKVKV